MNFSKMIGNLTDKIWIVIGKVLGSSQVIFT